MNKDKLVHDINSNLSSIKQALPIISETLKSDPEQADHIISLCIVNFEKLLNSWEELKENNFC